MSATAEKEILKEIRTLREILEGIEALLEERLIGVGEPLPDEIKAIREYVLIKGNGKIELIEL